MSKRVINGQGIHGADPPLAGQVEKDVADVSVGEFRIAAVEMLDDVDMAKLLKDFPDGLRFDSKLPIIRISIKVNAIETVYKFFNSAFGV